MGSAGRTGSAGGAERGDRPGAPGPRLCRLELWAWFCRRRYLRRSRGGACYASEGYSGNRRPGRTTRADTHESSASLAQVAPGPDASLEKHSSPASGDFSAQQLSDSPSTHLAKDLPTTDDSLGFARYATAIASFLTHEDSEPPLTISIHAPWGGGKTSLMLMIRRELDPAVCPLPEGHLTVDELKKEVAGRLANRV